MTVKNKRVKTFYIKRSEVLSAGSNSFGNVPEVLQDDVTIIGVQMFASLSSSNEFDSGTIYVMGAASRVAWNAVSGREDGDILFIESRIDARSVTVGAGVSEVAVGKVVEHELLLFPDGHGIDLDEGDIVYLNWAWANGMANDHGAFIDALVYYVER